MNNNLFSLFDEPQQNEESIQKNNNKKTSKKKTKSDAANLSLFEFDSVEDNKDNIQETNKVIEENVVDIEDKKDHDLSPKEVIISPIEVKEISSLENTIFETEKLEDIEESSNNQTEEIINSSNVENLENNSKDISDNNDVIEDIDESVAIENEILEKKIASPQTGNEEQSNLDNLPSLNEHLLSEIISTDYTMFLDQEQKIMELVDRPEKDDEIVNEELDNLNNEEINNLIVAPLPEWELNKKYYSIGEVAALFEVNTSHIRFWSKEFNMRLRTTRKGDRLYTPEDIQKLRLIHELVKVKKHTIKGAKEILNTQKNKIVEKVELKDQLKDLKALLLGIQKKL